MLTFSARARRQRDLRAWRPSAAPRRNLTIRTTTRRYQTLRTMESLASRGVRLLTCSSAHHGTMRSAAGRSTPMAPQFQRRPFPTRRPCFARAGMACTARPYALRHMHSSRVQERRWRPCVHGELRQDRKGAASSPMDPAHMRVTESACARRSGTSRLINRCRPAACFVLHAVSPPKPLLSTPGRRARPADQIPLLGAATP